MSQQTVAFQGTAPATSNPPGVTVIASIFLHYVEAWCLNRRSDTLEKRRRLMETWASYCEPQSFSKRCANPWAEYDPYEAILGYGCADLFAELLAK